MMIGTIWLISKISLSTLPAHRNDLPRYCKQPLDYGQVCFLILFFIKEVTSYR